MFEILTDEEIETLTLRKTYPAKCRALEKMGIPYVNRAGKSPAVSKKAAEQALGFRHKLENYKPTYEIEFK
jgi:hypothetical protein